MDHATLSHIVNSVAHPKPLEGHAYVVPKEGPYQAQHGEDRWFETFFKRRTSGFFVEVGAYDGVVLSNSYFFETIGWLGVLVEPDPIKAALCRKNRPKSRVFECAAVASGAPSEVTFYKVDQGPVYSTINMTDKHRNRLVNDGLRFHETRVRAMTLDAILESAGAIDVDFMTIDVEEGELEVLNGFDILRWRPKAVMVETNARFRKAEIKCYFVEHGYVFRDSVGVNDIYVPFGHHPLLTAIVDGASYVLRHPLRKIQGRLNRLKGRQA
jgi:FkbM family methyltransferase